MVGRLPRRAAKPAIEPVVVISAVPVEAEHDEDGRLLLASPIAAPARPVPTRMPPPASRLPRPVVKPQSAETAAFSKFCRERGEAELAARKLAPVAPASAVAACYPRPRPFAQRPTPPVEVKAASHLAPVTVRVPAPVKRPVAKARSFGPDDIPFD